VLADGTVVVASAEQNDDLFWAVRGGGGNLGVVTSFLFQAHPVATVCAGPMLWNLENAAVVMQWYREFITQAPEEMNGLLRDDDGTTGPAVPREVASPEDVRHRLVLSRVDGGGECHPGVHPQLPSAGVRICRRDAVSRAPGPV